MTWACWSGGEEKADAAAAGAVRGTQRLKHAAMNRHEAVAWKRKVLVMIESLCPGRRTAGRQT